MIEKRILCSTRKRKITGSFAFIEHRFLHDGFWASLNQHEILLYILLIVVADRNGLSYYSYDKICMLLRMSLDEYLMARNELIDKNLIVFDGYMFQVLSLPEQPENTTSRILKTQKEMEKYDPTTIRHLIGKSLKIDNY
jgi:hypothetical protein